MGGPWAAPSQLGPCPPAPRSPHGGWHAPPAWRRLPGSAGRHAARPRAGRRGAATAGAPPGAGRPPPDERAAPRPPGHDAPRRGPTRAAAPNPPGGPPSRPALQPHRGAVLAPLPGVAPAACVCVAAPGSPLARAEARAPRGHRASAPQPVKRGGRVTRGGAVGRDGLGATRPGAGGTAGAVLVAWLQAGFVPPRRPGQGVRRDQRTAHTGAGGTAAWADAPGSLRAWPP
jgi:hypothetical protein